VEPRHALISGVGECVEPVELPPFALLLVPAEPGLATSDVYAELDRLRAWREPLDPDPLRRVATAGTQILQLAAAVENDLERAALSLRPELEATLAAVRDSGALAARITGSGPTVFGVYADRAAAHQAAELIPRAIVTGLHYRRPDA
jgi:4-diphosphocytidyl-2-C-methyl-D-erythritol kinase